MVETKAAIERVIEYLTEEFIVEECVGNITDGCLSCEMIGVRASLRKAIEFIDGAPPYPPVGETDGRDGLRIR